MGLVLAYNNCISIHALLAESDLRHCTTYLNCSHFYPRSPCGERRALHCGVPADRDISIHALLAESDRFPLVALNTLTNFYPRSPCGERHIENTSLNQLHINFYPRSPCGERPPLTGRAKTIPAISIHALLAESDPAPVPRRPHAHISIHALLAESDPLPRSGIVKGTYFYPRSPCGERPGCYHHRPHLGHFYPRSPCGERRFAISAHCFEGRISIHALLAESDRCVACQMPWAWHFYPRSPCGERRNKTRPAP